MPNFQIVLETQVKQVQGLQAIIDQYLGAIARVESAAAATGARPAAISTQLQAPAVEALAGVRGLQQKGALTTEQARSITSQIDAAYRVTATQINDSILEGVKAVTPGTLAQKVRAQTGTLAKPIYGPPAPVEPRGILNPANPQISLSTATTETQARVARIARLDEEYIAARGELIASLLELRGAEREVALGLLGPDFYNQKVANATTSRQGTQSAQLGVPIDGLTTEEATQKLAVAKRVQTLEASIAAIKGSSEAEIQLQAELKAAKAENAGRVAAAGGTGGSGGGNFINSALSTLGQTASYGASATLLYGLVAQTKQAIGEALNLQRVMAELKAQAEGLGDSQGLAVFSRQLLDTAKATGVLGSQVVAVGIQMRGVFADNAQAAEATAEVIRASQVSGVPLASVVNSVTAASLSYGVSIDTITDKTIGLEQRFGITKAEGLTAFGDIAASAAQAGLSLDQVGGIIGALNQKLGQGAAASANALDRILPGVQAKTPDFLIKAASTPALQSSLPTLKDQLSAGETGPALLTLANSWSQLDKVTQNYFLNLLASRRDIPYLNALLSSSAQINAEVAKSGQDAGKASQYQAAQQETLGYQIKRMREELNQLVEALGKIGAFTALGLLVSVLQTGLGAVAKFASFLADINDTLKGTPGYVLAAVTTVVALTKAIQAFEVAAAVGGGIKALLGLGGAAAIPEVAGAAAISTAAPVGESVAIGAGGGLAGLFAGGGAAGIATGLGALAIPAFGAYAFNNYAQSQKREKAQLANFQGTLGGEDFSTVDKQAQDAAKATKGDPLRTDLVKSAFNKVLISKAKDQLNALSSAGVFSGTDINVKDLEAAANQGGQKGAEAKAKILELASKKATGPAQQAAIDTAIAANKAATDGGAAIADKASELQQQFQAGEISFSQYNDGLQKIISALAGNTDAASVAASIAAQRQLNASLTSGAQALADASFATQITQAGANPVEVARIKQQQVLNDRQRIAPGDDGALAKNTADQIAADKAFNDAQRQDDIERVNLRYDLQVAKANGNANLIAEINVARQAELGLLTDKTDPNAALKQQVALAQVQSTAASTGLSTAGATASARIDVAVALAGQNAPILAELAKQRADEQAKYAAVGDQAAQLQAEAARITADLQLQTYIQDAGKAKNELAQAIAASLGDVAQVAQLTVDQANAELAQAHLNQFFGVGDQAQTDRALAAATKAKTDQTNQARATHESDLAYLYATDKITAQQYIASLTLELQSIPESNKAARQAVEQKIFDIRKSLSSNLDFNIGNITLPTLYDAKRLEAGGGNYGVAQAVDNRQINISLTATDTGAVQAGFQQILDALSAPPRVGIRPRGY